MKISPDQNEKLEQDKEICESQRKVVTSGMGLSGDCRQTSLERKQSIYDYAFNTKTGSEIFLRSLEYRLPS